MFGGDAEYAEPDGSDHHHGDESSVATADEVEVRVDTNHAETPIAEGLRERLGKEARVDRHRLDVGDIEVRVRNGAMARHLVFERKTAADFAASICDGRYREQTTRMLAPTADGDPAPQYAIVVENASGMPWDVRVGTLPGRCVHGAMLKLALRDGIPVLMSTGTQHTVEIVAYLARELKRDALAPRTRSYAPTAHKRKRDNISAPHSMRVAMLTQVPGMSVARSEAVLDKYPTFATLITAPPKEIAAIRCGARALGPVLAQRMHTALADEAADRKI